MVMTFFAGDTAYVRKCKNGHIH